MFYVFMGHYLEIVIKMNACTIITGVLCIAVAFCQTSVPFYGCGWIQSQFVNCGRFTPQSYCGTNLVTYLNLCEFSRAHCQDGSIDLLHEGNCTAADYATASPVDGGEAVFDFFCTTLSKNPCPDDVNKVCATDGVTYINFCEYEKQRCTHRELGVSYYGDC